MPTESYPIVPGVRFKLIEDFPAYCVGDDGSVWSRHVVGRRAAVVKYGPWRKLKLLGRKHSDHLYVFLRRGSSHSHRFVHRLVLEAFDKPCPDGMEACHDPDPDPTNNRIENLRWDTHAANMRDSVRHGRLKTVQLGTDKRGALNGQAKLTEPDVIEIRRLAALKTPQRVAMDRFGISRSLVSRIVSRELWSHV
jgi:hypothetical protein